MKRIKLFALIIVALGFYGCETKNATVDSTETVINGCKIKIYVIDSCEYIGAINNANRDIITHKGNCKYCEQRKKK